MIRILSPKDCCGCNACGDVCTHHAISFKTDNEGFWYPNVDMQKCTDCHLCEKVCPIINERDNKKENKIQQEPACYVAIHKNLEIRFDSTSGGVFSALAEETYRNEGFVGGAIYREDFSAVHFISNKKEDLKRIRSSKYLQSDATGFYIEVRNCCETGKPVLVCGTPCQMVALRCYLKKDYENLIIVDFICNSVASPKAHRKYFDYLEDLFQSKAIFFKAKNKELGWRALTKKTIFANGKSHYGVRAIDYYSRAYHSKMIARPSCYDCHFKGYPRKADISLADFWDNNHIAGDMDDDIGTSAVIINTEKGLNFFKKSTKRLFTKSINVKDIEPGNPALLHSLTMPKYDRKQFFDDMDNMRFDALGDKYFPIGKETSKHPKLHQIRLIYHKLKETTKLRPKALYQFFYLNFFHPAIHTDWKNDSLFYPTPYCVFEIDKKADIQVRGPVRIGLKRFKKTTLETRILVESGAYVEFQGAFRLGWGADVEVFSNAELVFGADSGGNTGLTLICGEKIHIGSHTFYGRDVSIRDTNGGHIIAQQGYKNTRPVIIGDYCWLCSETKILTGVKIGDGSVIGSNSVVMSPIPARSLASGFPARVIDTNISWKH